VLPFRNTGVLGRYVIFRSLDLRRIEMNQKYHYYTRWFLEGDGHTNRGFHHSGWITEESPRDFLSRCLDNIYAFLRFDTLEELNAYLVSVNLTPFTNED
jgi:hypothetical protein